MEKARYGGITVGETRQKADRRVLENGANGGKGGVSVGKEGKHPLFPTYRRRAFRTVKLFGEAARVRENPPARRKNIFRFPIRPSSHQPSDCHRHAVTDYSRLREIRGIVCARTMSSSIPNDDVVLCYSTSISPLRWPPYHTPRGIPRRFLLCLLLPRPTPPSVRFPRFFLIFHTNSVMDLWIDGCECLFC